MKLYSTGQVAVMLGIHRDKILSALRFDAPKPSAVVARSNAFTREDVIAMFNYLSDKGVKVSEPKFDDASVSA